MDVPISLGVILALGMSLVETAHHAREAYFDSAIMLLFFLLIGRALDHAMRRKTRAVAGNLAALRADTAHRFVGDELVTVPAAALKAGDRLLVKSGERVPADGTIDNGRSEIDESLITGETARRAIAPGDTVYAGSLNYAGTLTLTVTAAGGATLIDEIETLLEKAASAKSRAMRLADRASRVYAPVVHITAALTFVGWLAAGASLHDAIVTAISVLIITCPCALALAIPAVQVVASGALFRANVILNSGDAIERLAEADTVVFDKTGTLTLPEPRVVAPAQCRSGAAADGGAAGAVEPASAGGGAGARGDVARAVRRRGRGAGARRARDDRRRRGASRQRRLLRSGRAGADARPVLHLFRPWRPLARRRRRAERCAPMRSRPSPALRALGLDLRILSGDRTEAVAPVAKALGIDKWGAELKPADKIALIEDLKREGRRVLMVGDGLNDAPSLAAAHVSLSPISAADLTQAQADAVFLGERLAPVGDAVVAARRARRLMTENLWLAVVYNMIAVPIAIAGAVTPLIAALAMSGSSLLVTLNALRARRGGVSS